jgi:hypothetical protein
MGLLDSKLKKRESNGQGRKGDVSVGIVGGLEGSLAMDVGSG